jgi:murein L,D-transpeptidase YafK
MKPVSNQYKTIAAMALAFLCWLVIDVTTVLAAVPYVVIMDKKTNQLYLSEYQKDHSFKTIKVFHATTGKVKGDKQEEGDLKTPEGVYQFKNKITQVPHPKFGKLIITLNFPNAYDEIAGVTGHSIWMHGTDFSERLKLDFDSEGCVVLSNEDIQQIEPYT